MGLWWELYDSHRERLLCDCRRVWGIQSFPRFGGPWTELLQLVEASAASLASAELDRRIGGVLMSKFLAKAAPAVSAKSTIGGPDKEFMSEHPAIVEYLTEDKWPDGSSRELATLLIFVEGGCWKCCLNDKARQMTGWASAGGMVSLLEALEGLLAKGGMDWRRAKKFRG